MSSREISPYSVGKSVGYVLYEQDRESKICLPSLGIIPQAQLGAQKQGSPFILQERKENNLLVPFLS